MNFINKTGKAIAIFTLFFICSDLSNGIVFSQQSIAIDQNRGNLTVETSSTLFSEIAKRIEPTVVNIESYGNGSKFSGRPSREIKIESDILDKIEIPQNVVQSSTGSGFLIDPKGYIITNEHVIQGSSRIMVSLKNGDKYRATVIGTDKITDLAVLKIKSQNEFLFAKLGDSDEVLIGEWVLAIGSPFGLAQTVTAGIVSNVKRESPALNVEGFPQQFIQTDAAINFGSSGGPLINTKGEVIGINSQIATASGESSGIGFALPSNDVLYVYKQILANGLVKRGYLGVVLDSVKQEFATVYGLPAANGAIITEMRDSGSAAGKAGLLVNDIITEFGGKKVENAQDLITKVAGSEPGKDYPVTYFREVGTNIEKKIATIKLAERPTKDKIFDNDTLKKKLGDPIVEVSLLGLTLTEVTTAIAKLQGIEGKKGVLVKEVSVDSILSEITNSNGGIALKVGDIIQRINRTEVTTLKAFTDIEKKLKKGDAVVLNILSVDRFSKTFQNRIVQFTIQ